MSEPNFQSRRRQRFLTETYFLLNRQLIEKTIADNYTASKGGFSPDDSTVHSALGSVFRSRLKLFRIQYTAGADMIKLGSLAEDLSPALSEWCFAYSGYLQELGRLAGEAVSSELSPLNFADLFDYQQVLDALSVSLLMGSGDGVRDIATLLRGMRGEDMLFEALVEPGVSDPMEPNEFFHEEPYGPLVDAIHTAETPEEASHFVKLYLENWYKSFEGVPWHNGHLVVTDEYSNYEGYWAFDAAAVCVIHGIDDSSFRDHMVYPKDLADWARANNVMQKIGPDADGSASALRCEGGRPCPKSGWWHTPARQRSRQHFAAGGIMPSFPGDFGRTIWQWDANQLTEVP